MLAPKNFDLSANWKEKTAKIIVWCKKNRSVIIVSAF